MSNPLDLIDNWPMKGPGNHSELSKKHDDWIKQLAIEIKKLQNELAATKLENRQLKEMVENIAKERDSQRSTHVPSFADLFKNESSETDPAMRAIVRNVRNELRTESRIEKNVVVCGLPYAAGSNENETNKNETETFEGLLRELKIDMSKVARRNRLKKKGSRDEKQYSQPPPLLIEFVDRETQLKALKNTRFLRNRIEFQRVFINPDRTEAERKAEAELRKERNSKNEALPFSSGNLRYGIDEANNKKFYWGVREGRLVKLEHRSTQTPQCS